MMFIDNVNERLGDDLKSELHDGAKLRVAAATFSIFAYEALRKELEAIDELRFIFTEPTFVAARATGTAPRQQREFFIPRPRRSESTLYGSEFEVRLRNQLTQRAIARECADWIRAKVQFRSNATGAPMQQMAAVDDRAAYQPIQGFTSADLGYERSDAVSNVVTKIDDAPMAAQFVALFDQIWHNADQLQDVTDAVCAHIESGYAENSPERIYFLILVNIFTEFLDDLSEDVLPNDRTGY
ncbi:MAG: ATP-dependent helicase, partial [Actinobacteria bacterium]|nr:ATP-dependent helicase [Actinomycetota bacterium]